MADGGESAADMSEYVRRARTIAVAHPSVHWVGDPVADSDSVGFEIKIEVPMPNAWRAQGCSPAGVQSFESVRLDFPPRFPVDPPEISLRPDFRRDIAHLQPWLTSDGRPVPCIQDGRMAEFVQQQGIPGILNQTVLWLERAAEGRLIDPDQGWELQRRDDVLDSIVADADALRRLVDRRGGCRFQKFEYFRRETKESSWLHGQIIHENVPLNGKTTKDAIRNWATRGGFSYGQSLGLIVWPGKDPTGQPIVCDKYSPDLVSNLGTLREEARKFGCSKDLGDALSRLRETIERYEPAGPFPLVVILCARRPFNLIGSTSPIELCIYLVDFYAANAFPKGDDTPVRPAAHRDQITPELLARLSGLEPQDNHRPWTLVGAGSLGSKIALHMARAGHGPVAIIDRAMMSPHNAARHALIPQTGDMQIMSMSPKADQLRGALAGLSQETESITEDVVRVLDSRALVNRARSKNSWVILNTTASLRTRAALCAASIPHRTIEALLYAEGRLGVIATEGPSHNPNIGDLITEYYANGLADARIRPLLFPVDEVDGLIRVVVGEGCGSPTMKTTDGRISMFAAGAAEYMLVRQREGLPDTGGEFFVGVLDETGLGVCWEHFPVAPVTIVRTENGARWSIRIHANAQAKIEEEVGRFPGVETGGVLMGRQDEATGSFHVVDVLPAPEDSTRSQNEFVLGTEGIRRTLDAYAKSTNVALYCLGTWHSHLAAEGPSNLDYQTARAIGLARLAPSVLLIHTPSGYRAVLADQETTERSLA